MMCESRVLLRAATVRLCDCPSCCPPFKKKTSRRAEIKTEWNGIGMESGARVEPPPDSARESSRGGIDPSKLKSYKVAPRTWWRTGG